MHNAIPAGGGFDELTTLICLHASSGTGRVFLELSKRLGTSRSIYSPDTPGCGESDAPPAPLSVAGYAEAIGDFLDSMRFRQVDLLGAHAGAAVAAELAIARPKEVRRMVMVGAPALDADARRSYRDLSAPEGTPRGALWARAAVIDWDGDAPAAASNNPCWCCDRRTISGRPVAASAGWWRAPRWSTCRTRTARARQGSRAGGAARIRLPDLKSLQWRPASAESRARRAR